MPSLPNILTNGNTADADEVMANFNALLDGFGTLRDEDLAEDAGIGRDKIADRFTTYSTTYDVVPYTEGADLGSPTLFSFPTTETLLSKHLVKLASGQTAFLAAVSVYAHDVNQGGTAWPTIVIKKNGLQVGETFVLDTDQASYLMANASPFASPLIALQDGDEIEIYGHRSTATGTPDAAGVQVTYHFKVELTAA